MAFLDETGLAELWSLVKTEDTKRLKAVTGSYKGTGTYGEENHNSINFGFAPKLVILCDGNTPGLYSVLIPGTTTMYLKHSSSYDNSATANAGTNSYAKCPATWGADGASVSWYAKYSAIHQYNCSGKTYSYIAIG